MRIGELAKKAGVSVSSVRFYESQGLMPKPDTQESGYREYGENELHRLLLIVAAKRQRFPLGLIRTVLSALDGKILWLLPRGHGQRARLRPLHLSVLSLSLCSSVDRFLRPIVPMQNRIIIQQQKMSTAPIKIIPLIQSMSSPW